MYQQYKKSLSWIIGLIFLFIIVLCSWMISLKDKQELPCGPYEQKNLQIGEKIIKVDISNSDCKRVLGLSGRKNLPDGTGMLFVFDKEGNYPFWMKDMNFPIDIIWVDGDFNVTGIEKNLLPETYPESFGEKYSAKYILELSAEFSSINNIKVGNKISF
jgi:hypothetical protein